MEIAEEAGLDATTAREALASGTFATEVDADRREARDPGATGVPFFVVDRRYGVSGDQPAETFTQVLDRAWADARPTLTTVGGDADACTDDTCAAPSTTTDKDHLHRVRPSERPRRRPLT